MKVDENGNQKTNTGVVFNQTMLINKNGSHSGTGDYLLTAFNVDDLALVRVNMGATVLDIAFDHPFKLENITSFLNQGSNDINFELYNNGGGYTWSFQIFHGAFMIYQNIEGQKGFTGADDGATTGCCGIEVLRRRADTKVFAN